MVKWVTAGVKDEYSFHRWHINPSASCNYTLSNQLLNKIMLLWSQCAWCECVCMWVIFLSVRGESKSTKWLMKESFKLKKKKTFVLDVQTIQYITISHEQGTFSIFYISSWDLCLFTLCTNCTFKCRTLWQGFLILLIVICSIWVSDECLKWYTVEQQR